MWAGIALACSFGNILATWMLFSWGSINLTYTLINVVEAFTGALLLRKLLPWYNPLQNLNDWIRVAIGSAVIPPLVGGVLVSLLAPALNQRVISSSGCCLKPLARWRWYRWVCCLNRIICCATVTRDCCWKP